MKHTFCIIVITAALAFAAAADTVTTVTLTQIAGITQGLNEEPLLTGAGTGDVSFKSTGNKNVKAELQIHTTIAESALIDIDKAYVKTRFPSFRTLIGKTRLSWGDGFFFNAGDVIFGSTNPLADLTGDEIRTTTSWLGSAFIPIGRFSFAEVAVVPPQIDLSMELFKQHAAQTNGTPYMPPSPEADSAWAGGRIQGKLFEIKSEAGYVYKGDSSTHNPYLSLQGNLYFDWYAAAAAEISTEEDLGDELADNSTISWGLFHIASPTPNITLNLRLEGLITPGGRWEEGDDFSAPQSTSEYYGIYLYPEISAGLPGSRTLFLRAVYSPIDTSAITTAGATWNIYQGFSILGYASTQIGEETDQFCFTRYGGYSVSLGVKYIY